MEILNSLIDGFRISLMPMNFFFCFIGVAIGTLIGVLPGIGPTGTVALLLPVTFYTSPVSAIILLAGVYYGAMYGGSTTSILVNIPGEAASVVTCLDGYQMARTGRAGVALGISAFGSFIAGTLGLIGLTVLAAPLASAALSMGPAEYFSLMCLGLVILIFMARGSMVKSLMMATLGLALSYIGIDAMTGKPRFAFGVAELWDGIGLIPVAMGLFGISEVLINVGQRVKQEILEARIKGLLPNAQDWKDATPSILRGSLVGFLLGVLPGAGAVIASFVSYTIEKRVSKHPEKFGTGVIQGVAGPESANNAASSGAFIPLFLPGNPFQLGDRDSFGGVDHPRDSSRPLLDPGTSRSFLGNDCQHVRGECVTLDPEFTPHRTLGENPQNPLSHPLSAHRLVLHYRDVQPE